MPRKLALVKCGEVGDLWVGLKIVATFGWVGHGQRVHGYHSIHTSTYFNFELSVQLPFPMILGYVWFSKENVKEKIIFFLYI